MMRAAGAGRWTSTPPGYSGTGACLRLEIAAFRGVISWEEVAWEDLPAAVQSNLNAPE